MVRYFVKRLLLVVPLVFVVSIIVFGLAYLTPGDPAAVVAGEDATPEQVEAVRRELGLDRPFHIRYADWVDGAARLELGTSMRNSEPISTILFRRVPITVSLVGGALVLSVLIGVSVGALAAWRPDSRLKKATSLTVAGSLATPNFLVGVLLILVFALWFDLLPATGYQPLTEDPGDWLRHMILPWIALASAGAGELARQTSASMQGVLQQDFVRTSRAKGLSEASVVLKHALKPGMLPIITAIGLLVGRIFAMSVVVEGVFVLPGIGSLMVEAVTYQDLPLIQGILLAITLVVVATNLLVDMSYAYFDPRIRDA